MSRVMEVCKKCAGGFVKDAEAGALRDVFRFGSNDFVQTVRQSARLANIDLVSAVVIDVGYCDSLVAKDVDPAGGIQARTPEGIAGQQLLLERFCAAKDLLGNVTKVWFGRNLRTVR